MHHAARGRTTTDSLGRPITKTSDVNIRAIFGVRRRRCIVIGRSSSISSIWLLFGYFDAPRGAARRAGRIPLAATQETRVPPEPRLQTNPREDLQRAARARGRDCSTSYGWVDKNAGVVRIPIDEAMKLTLRARAAGASRSATR